MRTDDRAEVIGERLRAYEEETRPIFEVFRNMVNLYSVARHIAIRWGNIVLNRIHCSRGGKKMRK